MKKPDPVKTTSKENAEATWTEPDEPVAAPVEPPSVDELAEALRGVVTSAVTAGGRDEPEVALAQEVLARIKKPGEPKA